MMAEEKGPRADYINTFPYESPALEGPILLCHTEPMEQREKSQANEQREKSQVCLSYSESRLSSRDSNCLSYSESRQRKTKVKTRKARKIMSHRLH